jgi:hypothetical protein
MVFTYVRWDARAPRRSTAAPYSWHLLFQGGYPRSPTLEFSKSSSVDLRPLAHDLNDAPPTSVTAANGESATSTSTCSLCAARLASSGRREFGRAIILGEEEHSGMMIQGNMDYYGG